MIRYLAFVLLLGALLAPLSLRLNLRPAFVEGVVGQPVDLFPGRGPRGGIDETIERLLFRSLFAYDEKGEIVSDLVDSYQVSSDGKVYDLTLKEAFWEDGEPITVTDVAFTFTQNPAFSQITIEQEGDREVRFILKNPLSSFLDVLTQPIAPVHLSGETLEVGSSGNFRIEQVRQEGNLVREISLRNQGGGLPLLTFRFFASEEELFRAARQGEVNSLSAEGFEDPSFTTFEVPNYRRYFALVFNLAGRNALVTNSQFRAAVAKRTPLVGGFAVEGPLSGTWAQAKLAWPTFEPNYREKFSGSITLTYPEEEGLGELASEIENSWEESLGVAVTLSSSSQIQDILARRDFEVLILGQEVSRDPDRYNLWHSSQKSYPGQNLSSWANPRADRALEEGRRFLERSQRLTHYLNFQKLFLEDQPAILLYHPAFSYHVSRKFSGIDLSKLFTPQDRFANFSDWKLEP